MSNRNRDLQELGSELNGYIEPVSLSQYKLTLPTSLYSRVQQLASQENTTVLELIRRAIKLELKVVDIQMEPGAEIILRRPGKPDERIYFIV